MKALSIISILVITALVSLAIVLSKPKPAPKMHGKLSKGAIFLYKYTKGDTTYHVYSTQEIIKVY